MHRVTPCDTHQRLAAPVAVIIRYLEVVIGCLPAPCDTHRRLTAPIAITDDFRLPPDGQ